MIPPPTIGDLPVSIIIDLNRIGPARFGCTPREWRGICQLAKRYQDNPMLDWPEGTPRDEREMMPRLCFARHLVRTGKISG